LKAVYDIRVSSADTIGAFNTGFETVNLHHPTRGVAGEAALHLAVAAQVEMESKV